MSDSEGAENIAAHRWKFTFSPRFTYIAKIKAADIPDKSMVFQKFDDICEMSPESKPFRELYNIPSFIISRRK